MDDKLRELIRKMTEGAPAEADEMVRLEWLQDQIRAYHRYLPARVVEKIRIDPKAKRIEGERRTVTIVFADLSGFTALSETMDAEDIAAVINDFFTRMVRIVFKYGGSVDKFLGDALMVLFGAPVAHHDDPERAVRASLEMQREMDRFNAEKKFDPPLGMSIGVNTGPVVALNVGSDERMEYTVIGDAVNLAARLEAVSTRGEIIISNYTYEKVAETVEAERRPAVRVKGKRKPIVIYLVKGMQEQCRLPETNRLPLVGRAAELNTVQECLRSARKGKGAVLGIVGEPGAGKTRLNAEIELSARAAGFHVIFGRCVPYETNQPYVTLTNLLNGFFEIKPAATDEEKKMLVGMKLKNIGLDLNRTLPYLGILYGLEFPETKDLPPAALKKRIYDAVRELFERLASSPLLVQIDDLQWADPTSIDLFDHLIPLFDSAPTLFSFAYRADYNFPWLGSKSFHGISLGNFDRDETQTFCREILGVASLPREITEAVFEKSQGNPRFIEEIVKLLLRKGGIRKSHDAARTTERFRKLEIAESLSSLILDQIDRLDESDRRLLQYASVSGRTFQPELLNRILKIPAAELNDKLEKLVHFEGLLAPRPESQEYDFVSPTTYEVVYGSLFKARRRELHGQIGRELENVYANQIAEHIEALAYHFARSEDEAKGVAYLKGAADKSYRLYALKETLAFFETALAILPKGNGVDKAEILKHQGWVYKLLGDFKRAALILQQSLKCARKVPSIKDEAAVAVNLGIVFQDMGQPDRGLNYFLRAHRLARKINDQLIEAQATQNIGIHYLNTGQWDKADENYRQVLEIYESMNNLRGVALANLNIGLIRQNQGDPAAARERYQKAYGIFRELGDKGMMINCLHNIGLIHMGRGEIPEAQTRFEEALSLAVQTGDKARESLMLGSIGVIHAQAWDLAGAFEKFNQSRDLAQQVGDAVQNMAMSINVGDVHLFRGQLTRAVDYHARAVHIAREISDPVNEGLARRSLAWDFYYQGEYKKSTSEFEVSRDRYLKVGDRRNAAISSLGLFMVNVRLGRHEGLADELNVMETRARERKDPEILGMVLDIRLEFAILNRDCGSVKALADELIEICKQINNKRLYAWTLARLGRILIHQENIEAGKISIEKSALLAGVLDDRILSAYCQMLTAEMKESLSDFSAARESYCRALTLARDTGGRDLAARILHRLVKPAEKKKKGPDPEGYREAYIKTIEDITRGFTTEEKIQYLKTLEK